MKNKYEIQEEKINKAIENGEILEVFDKIAKEMNIKKTGKFQKDVISYTTKELMNFDKNINY